VSAEESSPLEGTDRYEPERSMRMKLIIIGIALLFIMAAYAYVGTRDRSLDIGHDALISQQQEDGLVCCTTWYEHNGEPYLLVVTRELEGEFRRVVFRVMEFDDDGSPREINAIGSPFESLLPTHLSLVDQTVYIPIDGEGDAGVWYVDLTDPAWPVDAGFVSTAEGTTRQLAADDDLLAINHTNEIVVLDISNRTSPQEVSRFEQPESGVITLKLIDAWLFVNDAVNDEFRIYDLSQPDAPVEYAVHSNPDGPGHLVIEFGAESPGARLNQSVIPSKYLDFAVANDLIYLAASDLGVRVLDISDAGTPEIVAELELPDRASRLVRQDDRLYVLGASEGNLEQLTYSIHAVNISDPLEPQVVNTINGILTEPGIQTLSASDGRLIVGLYEALLVFDVEE
jgi:hypothetical protein